MLKGERSAVKLKHCARDKIDSNGVQCSVVTIADVIATVRDREQTLRVYNTDPDVFKAIEEGLTERNVAVEAVTTDSGRPANTAMLLSGNDVRAVAATDDLRAALEETIARRPPRRQFPTPEWVRDREPNSDASTPSPGESLLDRIADRTFTSHDTRRMMYLSREIEDRAWRVGEGRLFAGFQRAEAIKDQRRKYRRLANRGLAVHVYAGTPEATPPSIKGVEVHLEDTKELAQTWFVIFDGGRDPLQKSALLADRRGPDEYFGVVTYEPALVDRALAYLTDRYAPMDRSQRHSA